ncbi:MAG: ferritin family protein [Acidobacteriota bacterium]
MGLTMDFAKLAGADALDLAVFAENEAKAYYEEIASMMGRGGNPEAARFFTRMAGWEALHAKQIAAVRERLFAGVASNLANRAAWAVEVPQTPSGAAEVTLRQALEIALQAEVDAYEYYSGALEYVTNPEVGELFEALREAEQDHQRMLQQELVKL